MNTDDGGAGAALAGGGVTQERIATLVLRVLKMVALIRRYSCQNKIIMSTCMKFQFSNVAERQENNDLYLGKT